MSFRLPSILQRDGIDLLGWFRGLVFEFGKSNWQIKHLWVFSRSRIDLFAFDVDSTIWTQKGVQIGSSGCFDSFFHSYFGTLFAIWCDLVDQPKDPLGWVWCFTFVRHSKEHWREQLAIEAIGYLKCIK